MAGIGKWKKRKTQKLGRQRRPRGIWHDSLRTESNRLDLAIFSSGIELLSVEVKVDAAGVSRLDDDLFSAVDRAFSTGGQEFGLDPFAVGGDRDPRLFADLDQNSELAWSGGRGCRCGL